NGLFHGNGHMSISFHDKGGDMGGTLTATRDGAFFQWHTEIDRVYADWAVGQYRHQDNSGLPIYFSVRAGTVGAAGSSLDERSQCNHYDVNPPYFGAIPRIPSDIYVGDNNGSNLLYRAGTLQWNTLNGWDIDAFTTLNQPPTGWYFSVTRNSSGVAG